MFVKCAKLQVLQNILPQDINQDTDREDFSLKISLNLLLAVLRKAWKQTNWSTEIYFRELRKRNAMKKWMIT